MLNFVLMLSWFCRSVSLVYLWYLSHNYTRASIVSVRPLLSSLLSIIFFPSMVIISRVRTAFMLR